MKAKRAGYLDIGNFFAVYFFCNQTKAQERVNNEKDISTQTEKKKA